MQPQQDQGMGGMGGGGGLGGALGGGDLGGGLGGVEHENLAGCGGELRFVEPHADEPLLRVERLDAGEEDVDVVVFTSIAQTMTSLSSTVSRKLQDYLAGEKGAGKVSFVCASEAWRVKSMVSYSQPAEATRMAEPLP